ncbi:vitamin K epoxide reductase family protein [Candidatus Uhrbacteria bacterium]|nr:vitamin K epoxide reductase family protein [Candidatus Uhrbacteria bacterium]
MVFFTTFIVLAIFGLIDTGYLIYTHNKKKPMVCPLDHDCSKVTESKWSTVLGVRNEFLGFLFYFGMVCVCLAAILAPSAQGLFLLLLFMGTGIGVLYSAILVGVQFVVIKDYCFYCMISASITLLLFINSIVLLNK